MAKSMPTPTGDGIVHKEHGMPIGGGAYAEIPPEVLSADSPSEKKRKRESTKTSPGMNKPLQRPIA